MYTAVSLLLNAARAAAVRQDTAAVLAAVPRDDILDAVFTMLPLTSPVRQRLQGWSVQNSGSIGELLATVVASAREIETCLTNPAHIEQVRTIDQHLTILLAMNHLTGPAPFNQGTLIIDSLDLLHYIDRLHITGDDGTPPTILLGPSITSRDGSIRLPGSSYVAQRVTISYPSGTEYPRLNLNTPTASAYDYRPRLRLVWVQKPRPSYNLAVYTHKDRLMGWVVTELVDVFPTTTNQYLRLTFTPQCRARFLVTEVRDDQETPLARCIKIIPAPIREA